MKKKQTLSKKKLYEMKPFDDPSKERERKNALNAKLNRDRKKALIGDAYKEILKLKTINRKLTRDMTNDRRKLCQARREIKLLKHRLQMTGVCEGGTNGGPNSLPSSRKSKANLVAN